MDLDIEGNAALVVASSSGLGKASAKALAREGANVVVNGRDDDKLRSAVAELEETATGEVIGKRGDITDPDDVRALVDVTVDEFGGVDHVVTSAGGPPRLRFFEISDEQWYDAYDLLMMSVVRVVREAGEYLREDGGGTIVNCTSISTKEGLQSNVLSSSVRMAVVGLMKTLSKELAPEVRANAVLPGLFNTPRRDEPGNPDIQGGTDIPLGRYGEPLELGEAVAYLSSERSSYITGTAIPIDGGYSESNL